MCHVLVVFLVCKFVNPDILYGKAKRIICSPTRWSQITATEINVVKAEMTTTDTSVSASCLLSFVTSDSAFSKEKN